MKNYCGNCGADFSDEEALYTHHSLGSEIRCPDCASCEVRRPEDVRKTTVGTPYFASFEHACNYYWAYGESRSNVKGKIEREEIFIGEPPVPTGATLMTDGDGRYHIRG